MAGGGAPSSQASPPSAHTINPSSSSASSSSSSSSSSSTVSSTSSAASSASSPTSMGGAVCPSSPQSPTTHPSRPQPNELRAVSFLSVGQTFSGSQTVNSNSTTSAGANSGLNGNNSSAGGQKDTDEWRVNVIIQGLDLKAGTICGSMEALDVPKADSPVVTFWSGEIIDNRNFFFRTRRWGAEIEQDVDHWKKFLAFAPMHRLVACDLADQIDLSQSRYIFMRWKEVFFVSPGEECGLTIAGFYYVCMDRHTGSILGYYYDPHCQPYQRLQLNAMSAPFGHISADYEFN